MYFVTEADKNPSQALFVHTRKAPLVESLMMHLAKYSTTIVEEKSFPDSIQNFQYIFVFFDKEYKHSFFRSLAKLRKRIVLITYDKGIYGRLEELARTEDFAHLRIINADEHETHEEYIEKILWFATSSGNEKGLNLEKLLKPLPKKEPFRLSITMTRRRVIGLCLVLLVFLQVFFIVPLAFSTFYIYRAAGSLQKQQIAKAQRQLNQGKPFLSATEKSFAVSRPILAFFFMALIPENIIQTEKNAYLFTQTALDAHTNTKLIFPLLLKPQKTEEEIVGLASQFSTLREQIDTMYRTSGNIKDTLTFDNEKIKGIQERFTRINTALQTGQVLVKHIDSLLADKGTKNYVVYFYNNMEMRPGGGFIGSFAHVAFERYTLKDFKVYDVYDADGQLKAHVEPPKAIRQIMGQPNWFLRDSNFSPDFEQNVKTAQFFLDQELNIGPTDGSIGITTTAMSYMLEAFGDVYVPDFEETINKDNFYLKVQTKAEENFFPGSKQKKNYLSALGRVLFLKLEIASPPILIRSIQQAFDEKHIVFFMKDPAIQKDIDQLHWGGKLIYPQCAVDIENCMINHILPVDANLGVNKANYFVSKFMNLVTTFQKDGSAKNQLTITFQNSSASYEFPGGKYTNYFQLYFPNDAEIDSIEVNGRTIDDYDEKQSGFFKIIGTLIEVEPASSSYIRINYTLKPKALVGENAYQLVIQKQIGAFNSDFSFEVRYPDNMFVTTQNFKSLAKNNSVGYNSSLSTDKIFVIQFIKE